MGRWRRDKISHVSWVICASLFFCSCERGCWSISEVWTLCLCCRSAGYRSLGLRGHPEKQEKAGWHRNHRRSQCKVVNFFQTCLIPCQEMSRMKGVRDFDQNLPSCLLQVHEKPNAWAEVWLSFQDWESILGISMHIIYNLNHVFNSLNHCWGYCMYRRFETHKMPFGRCSLSEESK